MTHNNEMHPPAMTVRDTVFRIIRANRAAAAIIAVLVVQSFALLAAGRLAVTGHEVDAIHAVSAALRIAAGERPHLDFLTPLGPLAFEPVAVFLRMGLGAGAAFLAAHVLVALVLLPLILHVSLSRFRGGAAAMFGAALVVMLTALVYGGVNTTVSVSMYYNRWAWVLFMLAAAILLAPSDRPRPDAIVLGVCLSILALLKITFFVVLAPLVGVWLVWQRDVRSVLMIGAVGLGAVLLATALFGGVGFWPAYLEDLRLVAGSEVRPYPGKSLGEVLAAPAFLPGTLAAFAAAVGLRQSGESRTGLLLLLLVPGVVYITFQNWGNDPKWLILLAFLCLIWARGGPGAARLFGATGAGAFTAIGVVAATLIAPSFYNMASSPWRNLASAGGEFLTISHDPRHRSLVIGESRSVDGEAQVPLAGTGQTEPDAPMTFAGVTIPVCTQKLGYFGKMRAISGSLQELGYAGQAVAFADVNNPLPLIGPFAWVPAEAPWYYGGATALQAAQALAIPKCPISKVTFAAYMADIAGESDRWALSAEAPHFWLFTPR